MSLSNLPFPPVIINGYLWDGMKHLDPGLATIYGDVIPFFPISDAASGITQWENKAYVIYNRAFRVNHEFHEIKSDTIVYSLKGDIEQTFAWSNAIQLFLDREDDSAKDINTWNAGAYAWPVYFHSLRVYQNEPTEARDFAVKPKYVTTFMVKAKYHFTDEINMIDAAPITPRTYEQLDAIYGIYDTIV